MAIGVPATLLSRAGIALLGPGAVWCAEFQCHSVPHLVLPVEGVHCSDIPNLAVAGSVTLCIEFSVRHSHGCLMMWTIVVLKPTAWVSPEGC